MQQLPRMILLFKFLSLNVINGHNYFFKKIYLVEEKNNISTYFYLFDI